MATSPKKKYPSKNAPSETGMDDVANRRDYWQEQIAKANKRWEVFQADGDYVMDRFMLESNNSVNPGNPAYPGDKYNILYSSTETIKPSLYGQTPKVEVKNRQQDSQDSIKVAAASALENIGQYAIDMLDFDYVLQNVVSDYVLPGMGNVWVRYDPHFAPMYNNDNEVLKNDDGSDKEYLTFEGIALDYVHFKDWICGQARYWHEVPWVARKVYQTKKEATKRFGKAKADQLDYNLQTQDRRDKTRDQNVKRQALIYEIWDRENMEVVWYSENYPDDVLDSRPDPLKLADFFPCPRPLRAVWTTRSFTPKALYSQYKPQAAEMDRLTERIRYLTEALKVRGAYDATQESLANILDGPGNKMIPVQDWAALMGAGGITGVVQWVPLKDVVNCLTELYQQREICKNEIYEITGFSDIMRGISKASETLGAQQIKADWATGRLKDMQREVQRFIRDIIRLFIEIAAEHFSDKTMIMYSGVYIPPPTQSEIMAKQQYQQAMQTYPQVAQQAQAQGQPPPPPPQAPPPTQGEMIQQMIPQVLKLIRNEKLRLAAVGIETDSTILPDEDKERQDRMQFLASMGAFLQQATPMAMQFPDMRGLLGAIMMFTLRTFSASRPLEKEFENFQQKLEALPPTPPPGQEKGDNGAAAAQAQTNTAQIKSQSDQQIAQQQDATKRYEIDQKSQHEQMKTATDHEYRMAQLQLEQGRLNLERTKLGLTTMHEERQTDFDRQDKAAEAMSQQQDREDELMGAAEDKQNQQVADQNTSDLENRKLDIQEKALKASPKPGSKP